MTKTSEAPKPMRNGFRIEKVIYLFLFILAPVFFAMSAQIGGPLEDGFHEGEYLIAVTAIRDYYLGTSAFPVLVHGAMDFIPALMAGKVAGQEYLIVWTRLFNTLIVALCWVVYMDLVRTVLRNHAQRLVLLGAFIALFFFMTNAADTDPVHRQQSFIGTRDLFLMLSIWGTAKAAVCVRSFASLVFLILSGLAAALCLYWSYDRGVIAGVWMIMLSLGFIYQRKYKSTAVLLLSYVAGLFLASSIKILGTLAEAINNVLYWVKSSGDVWYMPLKGKMMAIPGAVSLMLFALLVLAFAVQWVLNNRQHRFAPHVMGIMLMQAVFLTKLYSLPSFPTNHYFVWPSIILLMIIAPELTWARILNAQLTNFWREGHGWHAATRGNKILFGALVMLTLSFFSNAVALSALTVRSAVKTHTNMELLDIQRYALDGLVTENLSCVFLWTNEGVLSLFLKKPACTKYAYPVYISRAQEATVLGELKKNPPGLIVYDSPFWSTAIFGRTMKERLPAIDQFINENYVFSKNRHGYVFATPKQK